MIKPNHPLMYAIVLLIVSACRESRSYVVLVTATPYGASGGPSQQSDTGGLLAQPTAVPSPTFIPTPDATRTSVMDVSKDTTYVVQAGDTLGQIAARYGVTVESVLAANGLTDVNTLSLNQQLIIPTSIKVYGPPFKIIPDSELVYGPAASSFDVASYLSGRDCFLCRYSETLDGQSWTGAQIVQRVATEQSINPRLLLALIEFEGHWLSQPIVDQNQAEFPMNYFDRPTQIFGLYLQLDWAGKLLSTGYYGWKLRGLSATLLADGTRAGLDSSINAGTAGVQVLLAQTRTYDDWLAAVRYSGFFSTYVALFGDPFQYAVEPLIPADLTQPTLAFPWAEDETWYFTGGPHGGWGSGSAWSSVDFVSGHEVKGCERATEYARAAADGVIAVSGYGMVILDLDEDGNPGTGWVVVYLHVSSVDRKVTVGQRVSRGDAIGHPSCEGGVSTATHLHIGRRYNGEWIAADCSACPTETSYPALDFDGWDAQSFGREYDGSFTKGAVYKEACTCRDDINSISVAHN